MGVKGYFSSVHFNRNLWTMLFIRNERGGGNREEWATNDLFLLGLSPKVKSKQQFVLLATSKWGWEKGDITEPFPTAFNFFSIVGNMFGNFSF